MPHDDATAARVRRALSGRQDVVETPMMGGLCFMVTGGMCCSVTGQGDLLVRIAPQTRDAVLLEPHVAPMTMRGRVMKNFVRVDPEGYRTEDQLGSWVQRGVDGAAAAKPERRRAPLNRSS